MIEVDDRKEIGERSRTNERLDSPSSPLSTQPSPRARQRQEQWDLWAGIALAIPSRRQS